MISAVVGALLFLAGDVETREPPIVKEIDPCQSEEVLSSARQRQMDPGDASADLTGAEAKRFVEIFNALYPDLTVTDVDSVMTVAFVQHKIGVFIFITHGVGCKFYGVRLDEFGKMYLGATTK